MCFGLYLIRHKAACVYLYKIDFLLFFFFLKSTYCFLCSALAACMSCSFSWYNHVSLLKHYSAFTSPFMGTETGTHFASVWHQIPDTTPESYFTFSFNSVLCISPVLHRYHFLCVNTITHLVQYEQASWVKRIASSTGVKGGQMRPECAYCHAEGPPAV